MARRRQDEERFSKQIAFFGTEEMENDIKKLMLVTETFNKSHMVRQIIAAGIEKLKAENHITE